MNKLTKKSKLIITFSAGISVLLILTIIALLITKNNNSSLNPMNILLISIIVVLAIVSLAVVIIVRLKKSKYVDKLNIEYYEVFETIQDAMKNSNLTKMEAGEVMNDITSMLFHAQMEKRSVNEVVGEDINNFIEKIKNSFGYRSSIVFSAINGVLYLIYILALMQTVIFLVRPDPGSFFNIEVSISILPYMAILAFFVLPFMRYNISKQKMGMVFFIPIALVVLYYGAHELFHYLDLNIQWIDNYLNGDFVFITSYVILFIYAAIVVICLFAKWIIRNRSIKKL